MARVGNVEQLVSALDETRNTLMTLANHCKAALKKVGKTVDFKPLLFPTSCQGFVYIPWYDQYKVSISLQAIDAIYQNYAFALLIIDDDCSGQLVNSLNDELIMQLFRENKSDVELLVNVLKQLPLQAG